MWQIPHPGPASEAGSPRVSQEPGVQAQAAFLSHTAAATSCSHNPAPCKHRQGSRAALRPPFQGAHSHHLCAHPKNDFKRCREAANQTTNPLPLAAIFSGHEGGKAVQEAQEGARVQLTRGGTPQRPGPAEAVLASSPGCRTGSGHPIPGTPSRAPLPGHPFPGTPSRAPRQCPPGPARQGGPRTTW